MKSPSSTHKNIADAVFKKELLPAAYRWISSLQPEKLELFQEVFSRLTTDSQSSPQMTTRSLSQRKAVASRYTMPEWNRMPIEEAKAAERAAGNPDPLSRPSTYAIDFIRYDQDQTEVARGRPTRTRDNDKSQINSAEQSPTYLKRWAERQLNTTYREEVCRSTFDSPIGGRSVRQQIVVYSKGVLNTAAEGRAEAYVNDTTWTRPFREMCRDLKDSINSTAYRADFTSLKTSNQERFAHPKWSDPVPVSRGMAQSPESTWCSEEHRTYTRLKREADRYTAVDQHRAAYSKPFDQHAITEKTTTTTFRSDFTDHMADRDDHPMYFEDMRVRIPPGTGPAGKIVGDGRLH